MNCSICNSENNVINHHVSYKLNKTVLLCRKCHTKVHQSKNFFSELRPLDQRGGYMVDIDDKVYMQVKELVKELKKKDTLNNITIKNFISKAANKELKKIKKELDTNDNQNNG